MSALRRLWLGAVVRLLDCQTRERHEIVRRIRQKYSLTPGGPASIYVLHFVDKSGANVGIGHAKHYIGFVGRDLDRRLGVHRYGEGAKIVKAVLNKGNDFVLALAFKLPLERARSVERRLKDNGSGVRICPLCANLNRSQRATARQIQRLRKRLSESMEPSSCQ